MKAMIRLFSHYVNSPAVAMRATASPTAKVVSQGLFNEKVDILATEKEWVCIRTPDHYEGWVLKSSLVEGNDNYAADVQASRLNVPLYAQPDVDYGPVHIIPYGTHLKKIQVIDERWMKVALPNEQECYVQIGEMQVNALLEKAALPLFSQQFLKIPYIWGGRSSLGFDCSGFMQMLYGKIGVRLPRDSCQQVEDLRFLTVDLLELTPGDLIFFGRSKASISHVGMSIGRQIFIHTSTRENMPWVRVSHLADSEWCGNARAYYAYRTARQLK